MVSLLLPVKNYCSQITPVEMRCQLNKKILLLIFEVIPGFPALVKAEQVKLMKKNDFFTAGSYW